MTKTMPERIWVKPFVSASSEFRMSAEKPDKYWEFSEYVRADLVRPAPAEGEVQVKRGSIWLTRSGRRMQVVNIVRHADYCPVKFVFYQNLDATFDSPPGSNWVLPLETFTARFSAFSSPENDTPSRVLNG